LEGETARLKDLYPQSKADVESGEKAWKAANPAPEVNIGTIADHIDHIVKTAGIDHVGIGGDFDGIKMTPDGFGDVSRYPYLFVELLKRGYSDSDIAQVAGQNVLRVFKDVEKAATKLSKVQPSDELIEELDASAK
jgi:membrane dipeptidase